jgi:nucleoside 2-deoxyribosyltransferase
MRVYLAGPLFTWGEREQNKAVASELRSSPTGLSP